VGEGKEEGREEGREERGGRVRKGVRERGKRGWMVRKQSKRHDHMSSYPQPRR
jgi:hypothetical protein